MQLNMPVKQVGAFDGSSFRSLKCDNKGRLANFMHMVILQAQTDQEIHMQSTCRLFKW